MIPIAIRKSYAFAEGCSLQEGQLLSFRAWIILRACRTPFLNKDPFGIGSFTKIKLTLVNPRVLHARDLNKGPSHMFYLSPRIGAIPRALK